MRATICQEASASTFHFVLHSNCLQPNQMNFQCFVHPKPYILRDKVIISDTICSSFERAFIQRSWPFCFHLRLGFWLFVLFELESHMTAFKKRIYLNMGHLVIHFHDSIFSFFISFKHKGQRAYQCGGPTCKHVTYISLGSFSFSSESPSSTLYQIQGSKSSNTSQCLVYNFPCELVSINSPQEGQNLLIATRTSKLRNFEKFYKLHIK